MKIVKYVLIASVALLVLAIAADAVFVATFDPNRYKGQIEAAVKEKTGRTLKLQGDLKVAVFPSLGADLCDVGAQAGEDGHFQVALQLECAAGLFLDRGLDLALVAVRIEGRHENSVRRDRQNEQGDRGDEDVLDDFHAAWTSVPGAGFSYFRLPHSPDGMKLAQKKGWLCFASLSIASCVWRSASALPSPRAMRV